MQQGEPEKEKEKAIIQHNLDTIKFFAEIKVATPFSVTELEKCIKSIRERKEFYENPENVAKEEGEKPKEEQKEEKQSKKARKANPQLNEEEFPSF
jgi:valyl-tRNA synthetase